MLVAVLRPWIDNDGHTGTRLFLWCPGCDQLHAPEVENTSKKWEWNGSLEVPTLSPSILVHNKYHCHSYVKAGQWEFLGDSLHSLAGQVVPLPELPDWLVKES